MPGGKWKCAHILCLGGLVINYTYDYHWTGWMSVYSDLIVYFTPQKRHRMKIWRHKGDESSVWKPQQRVAASSAKQVSRCFGWQIDGTVKVTLYTVNTLAIFSRPTIFPGCASEHTCLWITSQLESLSLYISKKRKSRWTTSIVLPVSKSVE